MQKVRNNKKAKQADVKRALHLYNSAANFFWSALSLVPMVIFCYSFATLNLLFFFGIASMMTLFLPNAFFQRMQLSTSSIFYKNLGVGAVNKFSQNGAFIHRLLQRRFPEHKLSISRSSFVRSLEQQSRMYERFHFAMAVFFGELVALALWRQLFWWAAALTLINIAYNVYPILLQQYIRLKLHLFKQKEPRNRFVFGRQMACRKPLCKTG